jgi:ATP-dependent DNA helicase PIF1
MIGLKLFSWLNQRCRETFPISFELPFGRLNVIMAGDFFQLPPVLMKPLFYDKPFKDPQKIHGRELYLKFDTTVEFDVIRRQQSQDSRSSAFKTALENLRNDNVTKND